ncbi:hypothetical protein BDV59DRAFT_199950 [Aspergillus ambiguus]|uniref:uncharacterized protein n=1 Tax=Aspergillus ambiguus TaxID=176160 RepID=UPI003CCD88EB
MPPTGSDVSMRDASPKGTADPSTERPENLAPGTQQNPVTEGGTQKTPVRKRRLNVANALKTPDPFNINKIDDVNREIDRLEDLVAEHFELNRNPRFLTRFKILQNQKTKLEEEGEPDTEGDNASNPETSSKKKKGKGKAQNQPKRPQILRKPTMELDADADIKILSDEDLVKIAMQPPSFRKNYSRYWNSDGKIKEQYFRIVFRRDDAGELVLPDVYRASNIENHERRLRQFEHPEWYNHRGELRKKSVKVRKDQRDPEGHFIRSEVDELNRSTRDRVLSSAMQGESVLGLQTMQPPSSSKTSLKGKVAHAEGQAIHLRALINEQDAFHREEIMKNERANRELVKRVEKEKEELKRQHEELMAEVERLKKDVNRLNKVIDRLTGEE